MTMRSLTFVGVLSALAVTASAQGQDNRSVSPVLVGSRVRITLSAVHARLTGLVVALDESDVTLAPDGGGVVKIPVPSITGLEVSRGRQGHVAQGAWIGFGVGLIAGLSTPADETYFPREMAVVSNLLVGSLVGAAIGAVIKSDRWSVGTLSAARPQVRYGRPPFGLVVAVRF